MTGRRSAPWIFVVAVALVALVLRGPIVAVAPVIDAVRADLALSSGQAGVLTSIPVLCFALATPLALLVIRRAGPDAAVTVTVIGVALGTILRSAGDVVAVVAGTVVIGVFITIGNVVLPVVIRRDFSPARSGLATGVYTSALNVGSMLTSLGTAPLAGVVGWPVALLAWGVLVLVAVVVWSVAVGPRTAFGRQALDEAEAAGVDVVTGEVAVVTEAEAAAARRAAVPLLRRATTWGLTLAFAGQAFGYYGLTAWMPTLLADEVGLTREGAGASSAVFQILAVVGALGVPLLALRVRPAVVIGLVAVLWTAMPLGLLFAPQAWLLWSIIGGAAQGGGITIVFIVIVRMATTDTDARRLSALVQGGGYALAALGPLAIGGLHDASGAWTVPLLAVFASVLVLGVSGVLSSRRVA